MNPQAALELLRTFMSNMGLSSAVLIGCSYLMVGLHVVESWFATDAEGNTVVIEMEH
jgi:hypothetical protein